MIYTYQVSEGLIESMFNNMGMNIFTVLGKVLEDDFINRIMK